MVNLYLKYHIEIIQFALEDPVSALGILEVQNLPFLGHLQALKFDFYEFLYFL